MIPRLANPDSSLAFIADGYHYISRVCDRMGTDAVRTRLMGRPVVLMRGGEATRIFYEGGRFDRSGAMPASTFHLLQDEDSVQTLEGAPHRLRKSGFLALLQGGEEAGLAAAFEREFSAAVRRWSGGPAVSLHDELAPILSRAVFRWAGIPEQPEDVFRDRTEELSQMVERAGSFGPVNWAARLGRHRTEQWAVGLIRDARSGAPGTVGTPATPLAALAAWRDEDGRQLEPSVAAVELLNLLRPTVALVRFLEFAALALARRPLQARLLRDGDPAELTAFADEVRRRTPFFPVIAGRVRHQFDWHGHRFRERDWAILDIHGTNHDARLWRDPQRFRPQRFTEDGENPRHIVAQGGGDYLEDHRCPGEPATDAVIVALLRVLLGTDWSLEPGQDLRVTYSILPAKVRSSVRVLIA
ncbi:MAG TPA: cytochrome P450 [Naasia sp.]|jgi:fatty-acid peroxygenase